MLRNEILDMMARLKLKGMHAVFDALKYRPGPSGAHPPVFPPSEELPCNSEESRLHVGF